MTLGRPQAVLFDWDNTLVDCWGVIHRALSDAFVAMGQRPWTFDEAKLRVRRSLRDSFPELFGDRWTEAREVFYSSYHANHLAHLVPLPGAEALLESLAAGGIALGVVSNKDGNYLRAEADHLGWRRHFAAVVGATDAAADKPAAAPVVMALAAAGIEPGPHVWFVGDAAIDMECAYGTGCRAVLVGPGVDVDALRSFPPHARFEDCTALRHLVQRW